MSHPHQEILDVINRAFGFPKKPSPDVDRNHCDDCCESYDYIIRLNPSDVSLGDFRERWQFESCGKDYRKYLFPGICRECLDGGALGVEILFSYIDGFGSPDEVQRDGLAALYRYLFDCGFALEEQSLHRELRERLAKIKSEPDEAPNLDSAVASSK